MPKMMPAPAAMQMNTHMGVMRIPLRWVVLFVFFAFNGITSDVRMLDSIISCF